MATPITSKCYKIGTDYPRGYGVVIVNSFLGENEGERKGAEVEIKNLSSLFKDFGLEVKLYEDRSADQILKSLTELSKSNDLFNHSVLVVAISSHGNANGLYGKDGDNLVTAKEINSIFSSENCQNLVGKPKVFIFNACRIHNDDIQTDRSVSMSIQERIFTDEQTLKTSKSGTRNSDILNIYSCLEGYASNRSTKTGSLFISTLCEIWKELGNIKSLSDILTHVNGSLIEICTASDPDNEGSYLSQCCVSHSTLTAELRLGSISGVEVIEMDSKPLKRKLNRRSLSFVKSKKEKANTNTYKQPLAPVRKEFAEIESFQHEQPVPDDEDMSTCFSQAQLSYPIQAQPDYLMQTVPNYFIQFMSKFFPQNTPKAIQVNTPTYPIHPKPKDPIQITPKDPIQVAPKNPVHTTPKDPGQVIPKYPIQTTPKDSIQTTSNDPTHTTPKDIMQTLPEELMKVSLKDLLEIPSTDPESSSKDIIENPLRALIEISLKQMMDVPLKDLIQALPKELIETPFRDIIETPINDLIESSFEDSTESLSDHSTSGVTETLKSNPTEFFLCGTAYDEVSTVYIADATNARVWCYDVTQNLFPGYIYDPIFKTHPPYGIVADENLVIVSCGTTLLAFDAKNLLKVEQFENNSANFSGIDINSSKVYAASNFLSFTIYTGTYSLDMKQMSLSMEESDLKKDMYLCDLKVTVLFLILLFGNTKTPLCVFNKDGGFLYVILRTTSIHSYRFFTMDHVNDTVLLGEETSAHILKINIIKKVYSKYAFPQLSEYRLGGVSLLTPELVFVALNTDKTPADLSKQCLKLTLDMS